MTIIFYLFKILLRAQLLILFIIFVIFFCYRFMRGLNIFIDSNVSICLVLLSIILNLLELGKFILPISLFFGLLITLQYLRVRHEILAIYVCGIGHSIIIYFLVFSSLLTSLLLLINVTWVIPWYSSLYNKILISTMYNFKGISLSQGTFNSIKNNELVLFINNFGSCKYEGIFSALYNKHKDIISLIISSKAYIHESADGNFIILNKGVCYANFSQDILNKGISNIFYFDKYIIQLDYYGSNKYCLNNISYMTIPELWRNGDLESIIELNWRLMLVISVFILSFMVLPLSIKNIYRDKLYILLIIILCFSFFLLQVICRFYILTDYLYPYINMWLINLCYFVVVFVLNIWDFFYKTYLKRILIKEM